MNYVTATATATAIARCKSNACATAIADAGDCSPCPPCPPYPPEKKTPVILFTDTNTFDDFISIILLAKDPSIDLKLVVIEYGFNEIDPSIDVLGNLLDWLHNKNVKIVRGYFLSEKEVKVGFNPTFEENNKERVNTVGLPFCKQIVGGAWRGCGSLIYGNQKRIPVSTRRNYYFKPVNPPDFIFAEDHVKMALDEVSEDNKCVLFATGPLTTFSKFIKKYIYNPKQNINNTQYMLNKVKTIRIMGGNFNNTSCCKKYLGVPPVGTLLPDGTTENGLTGNVFTLPTFNASSNYKSQTECNTSLDPEGAKIVYDYLSLENVNNNPRVPPSYIVTTNATDNMFIPFSINQQLLRDKTYESELVSYIFDDIAVFEGGIEAFNYVIKIWDVASTILYFNPSFIETVVDPSSGSSTKLSAIKGKVRVHLPSKYPPSFLIKPFNAPVDGDFYYGEMTFKENINTNLYVVYDNNVRNDGPNGQNPVIPLILENMVARLKSKIGTATVPLIQLDI